MMTIFEGVVSWPRLGLSPLGRQLEYSIQLVIKYFVTVVYTGSCVGLVVIATESCAVCVHGAHEGLN